MASVLNPYLNFDGDTREAMEFYQSVFGGELTLSTFADFGQGTDAEKDKIMHSQLTTPSGYTLMAADTPIGNNETVDSQTSVSLSGDDEAELRGYWEKLVVGGTVIEPLAQAPWGDHFGMAKDRFGVSWLVNITAAAA